jgi:hypothetical protein
MTTFGNSPARGRRAVPRASAPLVVALSTSGTKNRAELIDVSRTGARLKGGAFPDEGEELTLEAEKIRIVGEVVWSDGDQCAVAFDTPIAIAEVKRIRALARLVEVIAVPRNPTD